MKKLTTCLWFDTQAEEAVKFYRSVFKGTKILKIARYPKNSPGPAGKVMTVYFEMLGQKFLALNGGPHFKFTEAISLIVDCKNQKEVDTYWKKLTADGGKESQCGWLKDKFGLSWQITPAELIKLTTGKNKKKNEAAFQAMLKMRKIDIQGIRDAYNSVK